MNMSCETTSPERGGRMRPLSIVVWFNRAFKNIGLKGCSSHSGRRKLAHHSITKARRGQQDCAHPRVER
jgi:hypothetical protein